MRQVRCPQCESLFDEDDVMDEKTCPKCATSISPRYTDLEIELKINWDALRLLANFADSWAEEQFADPNHLARQELDSVLEQLKTLRPPKGLALTLADEYADLLESDPEKVAPTKPKVKRRKMKPGEYLH